MLSVLMLPRERIIDPTSQDNSTSASRLQYSRRPFRQCLRKGCENRYQPRQGNQCFCRDPVCRSEVRRWQAAKRQQRWRADADNRVRQADRERIRRQLQRQQAQSSQLSPAVGDISLVVTSAAAAVAVSGVLSRNSKIPKDFCDRPGCYEPTRPSHRNRAKYCSNACQNAMQRVRDRQRKRLARARSSPFGVLNYGRFHDPRLSFHHSKRSEKDDRQTDFSSRPRPPPTI